MTCLFVDIFIHAEYSYVDVTDPTNFVTRPTTLQVSDEETFSFMTFDKSMFLLITINFMILVGAQTFYG